MKRIAKITKKYIGYLDEERVECLANIKLHQKSIQQIEQRIKQIDSIIKIASNLQDTDISSTNSIVSSDLGVENNKPLKGKNITKAKEILAAHGGRMHIDELVKEIEGLEQDHEIVKAKKNSIYTSLHNQPDIFKKEKGGYFVLK